MKATARFATWCAFLSSVLVALVRLGAGPLSTPPVTSLADLDTWIDAWDPVTVVLTFVRVMGIPVTVYLLAITLLGCAARVTRSVALVRLADRATLPAVRRLLAACAGVTITAASAGIVAASLRPEPAVAGTADARPIRQGIVLRRIPDEPGVALVRLPDDGGDEDGLATMRVDEPGERGDAAPGDARAWVTRPGDHLWHISEAALTDARRRPVDDEEIARYWRQVIEANRASLPDPDNPDLIYPGEVITLPPLPPPA